MYCKDYARHEAVLLYLEYVICKMVFSSSPQKNHNIFFISTCVVYSLSIYIYTSKWIYISYNGIGLHFSADHGVCKFFVGVLDFLALSLSHISVSCV